MIVTKQKIYKKVLQNRLFYGTMGLPRIDRLPEGSSL
jgi:hypothetical protein